MARATLLREVAGELITGDRGAPELPAEEPFRVLAAELVSALMARHRRNDQEEAVLDCSTRRLYSDIMHAFERTARHRRQSAEKQEARDKIWGVERKAEDMPTRVFWD